MHSQNKTKKTNPRISKKTNENHGLSSFLSVCVEPRHHEFCFLLIDFEETKIGDDKISDDIGLDEIRVRMEASTQVRDLLENLENKNFPNFEQIRV